MAEIEKKNEWGAGILAISATVFIGAAIPVILYFVLYTPQVQRKNDQKARTVQMTDQLNKELQRGDDLAKLRTEGEEVAKALEESEKRFGPQDTQSSVDTLLKMLTANNLRRTPEAVTRREKDPIRRTDIRAEFPGGLQAAMVTINCFGKWSDFVTFIAAAESHKEATFVVGEMIADGDRNGKEDHTFLVDIWIIQRRNVDAIGRSPVAPAPAPAPAPAK